MLAVRDTFAFDMFSAEARWERISHALFVTGCLFVIFTIYGLYSRDDWQGLVMTAAPAAVCFAGWWLARARAEYLLSTAKPSRVLTIATSLLIVGGFCALVWEWSHPRVIYVQDDQPFQNLRLSPETVRRLQESAYSTPPAPRDPTLDAPAGCDEWVREADKSGEMIGYCKRWAAKTP